MTAKIKKDKEREIDSRIDSLKHLDPEAFAYYERTCRGSLEEIIEGLDGRFDPSDDYAEGLLKKWCLNFLVLLILQGGGQRPQVYAAIKSPELTDLIRMDQQQRRSGHFTLVTGTEKRARPRSAPRFTLPAICFKFVEYHAKYVRPFLVGKRSRVEPEDQECLLLDTRTGTDMNRRQITRSLKAFIRNKDRALGDVITSMDVRSSFATIKLLEYKEAFNRGETTVTRKVFLESLAAVMNTSTEMLKQVYLAIDDSDYLLAAKNVYRYVREEDENEGLGV